jgi:hypothetical protein
MTREDAYPPDFASGPVQMVDMVAVEIFGRVVIVPAEEHESLCRELAAYHAKLPGPPDPGQVDRHGKAKPRGKAGKGKGRKPSATAGDLFGGQS